MGTSTSFIWRHGWRIQERNKARSYHFLCHICFLQKGTHTKLIKSATGAGGAKDHLKRSHGITEDGRTTKKRLFNSPEQSNVSAASSNLSASMPPPEKLTYGNAINDYYIHFDPSEFKCHGRGAVCAVRRYSCQSDRIQSYVRSRSQPGGCVDDEDVARRATNTWKRRSACQAGARITCLLKRYEQCHGIRDPDRDNFTIYMFHAMLSCMHHHGGLS